MSNINYLDLKYKDKYIKYKIKYLKALKNIQNNLTSSIYSNETTNYKDIIDYQNIYENGSHEIIIINTNENETDTELIIQLNNIIEEHNNSSGTGLSISQNPLSLKDRLLTVNYYGSLNKLITITDTSLFHWVIKNNKVFRYKTLQLDKKYKNTIIEKYYETTNNHKTIENKIKLNAANINDHIINICNQIVTKIIDYTELNTQIDGLSSNDVKCTNNTKPLYAVYINNFNKTYKLVHSIIKYE